ncbi:MAG TPA: ABC transporter permease, partial [Propionibacteriaceae bacterium]
VIRNPGRAAATCTALMLAVGLIVTLQVGAASLKSTTNNTLNSEFPVDVTVTNPMGPLSPTVMSSIEAVPGVKATIGVRTAEVGIQVPTGTDDPTTLTLAGLPSNADTVVAAGTDRLSDRVALAHHFTIEGMGRQAGDPITLVYQGQQQTFTLEASDIAQGGMLVVPEQTLTRLAPDAPLSAVWAAAADRNQAADVIAAVRKVMGAQPGLSLGGSLEQAAGINALLDTLLQVATGLLAVAVAIAMIGVGNTLGLSVIERTRESALLRALGLQRRQLRLMLMVEAVLLALVGAVVGIGAGMLFGYVGVAALVKETSLSQLRFSMSVPQTVAVVLVTCVAGALASVLPGRRAAMAAPTAALAET